MDTLASSYTCTDTSEVPSQNSSTPPSHTCIDNLEVSSTPSDPTDDENTSESSSSTLASSYNTDIKTFSEAQSCYTAALSSSDTENSEAPFYTPAPSNIIDAENREAPTYSVTPSGSNDNAKTPSYSLAQHVRMSMCSFIRHFPIKEVPKVDKLLTLCRETIQASAQHLSTKVTSGDYVMNRYQCDLLVQRLVSVTQATLAHIQHLPLLDETAIPVLKELHQTLLNAETLIKSSCITNSNWPRAAIEQDEMKETFSKLLYDIQWYTSVLLSILVDNSKKSRIRFEPESCDGQLSMGDELDLLIAMKKDEESLKTRLRAVKLDDPTEQGLADQLLNQMEALLESSTEHRLAADDQLLNRIRSLSSDFLFLNPDHLELGGKSIGRGAFGEVRITSLLGSECAMKIIYVPAGWSTQDVKNTIRQEMNAIKELGHHPHIVRLLCYSIKTDEAFYLIMEKMQMDLFKCLLNRKIKGKDGKEKYAKLSDVDAVSLMLQIGEGMEYIHSKDMVHRDLKPQNVLVNLENPSSSLSRICSVKIADFGLTKSKEASRTCSNNTVNTGWTNPYTEGANPCMNRKTKKQVKAGMRPNLPTDCLPRLATLITKCWAGNYYERPLFPEICRELRYIKGLLFKGDERSTRKLQTKEDSPFFLSMDGALLQGPWGGKQRALESVDVATSIKQIKLRYNGSLVACMEVTYELLGFSFERIYSNHLNENVDIETITFKQFEFITRVSGYYSQVEVRLSNMDSEESKMITITCIVSLTIHTNRKSYGPYGVEEGKYFTSVSGRIIGFLGAGNGCLDRIGVVVIPGDMK